MSMIAGRLYLLGCGPGSMDYVTPLVRSYAQQADVLIGCRRTLDLFPEAEGECHVYESNLQNLLEFAQKRIKSQDKVCWLATGDTGLFSIAATARRFLGDDNCVQIPGVSAVQVACARLGLDWSTLQIQSLHGRSFLDWKTLDLSRSVALLTGGSACHDELNAFAEKMDKTHLLYACQNLTYPSERVEQIPALACAENALLTQMILVWKRKINEHQ